MMDFVWIQAELYTHLSIYLYLHNDKLIVYLMAIVGFIKGNKKLNRSFAQFRDNFLNIPEIKAVICVLL